MHTFRVSRESITLSWIRASRQERPPRVLGRLRRSTADKTRAPTSPSYGLGMARTIYGARFIY